MHPSLPIKGYHAQGQLWPWVWPPPEQIVAIPPWEDMYPFLALKTKIRKVIFKRSSSWMLSLPEICCEIYVVMKYNNSELWDNSELWNNNWTLKQNMSFTKISIVEMSLLSGMILSLLYSLELSIEIIKENLGYSE